MSLQTQYKQRALFFYFYDSTVGFKQLCLLGYNIYKYIYIYRHTVLLPYLQGIGSKTLLPSVQFSSVQSHSCVWLFVTPRIAARQASLSITNSWNLTKLMSIESVMTSNHLLLCHPLLLLPPLPPSIRVFSNESTLRMITSWQMDVETVETVSDLIFWGSTITADGDCSHEIKRRLLLGRKVMTNP